MSLFGTLVLFSASAFALAPTITSFTPAAEIAGNPVTVTGTHFGAAPRDNTVKVGNVAAQVTSVTSTTLVLLVPDTSLLGSINITTAGGTVGSGTQFSPIPVISGISPTSGPAGTQVTLTGTNLGNTLAGSILINGLTAQLVISGSDVNKYVVTIPTGATSGQFTINTSDGRTGTSTGTFTVTAGAPTVTGFTPTSGPVGTSVAISGTNFSTTSSANTVTFGGVASTSVVANSTTSLTAAVPSGAVSGPIAVTVASVTGTSSSNFTVTTPAPTIATFVQGNGLPGTAVTISGTNFDPTAANNIVKIGGVVASVATGGTSTMLPVTVPAGVVAGPVTVTVAGQTATSNNSFVVAACPAYTSSTLAGSAGNFGSTDGTGTAALFNTPSGVAADATGNLYVTDAINNTVRKITAAGVVTTFAGTAGPSGSTDGTGTAARFKGPAGITIDTSGNLYVVDAGNSTIRKITSAGVVTTLAGLAGTPGSTDGTGTAARFSAPKSIAVDTSGTLYVTDKGNSTIRLITPAGVVTTLAGLAGSTGSVDGTGSAARFLNPYGIAVDASHNAYVTDTGNGTIRKITSAGVVTTIAGVAGTLVTVDGTGTSAHFRFPAGIAIDAAGNLYIGDLQDAILRTMSPAGLVSTVAGIVGTPGIVNGAQNITQFNSPNGVAVDSAGALYVADSGNYLVRKLAVALSCLDSATFVSQSVPTSMTTGVSYAVSVTMKNTGSATWTTAQAFKLGAQNPQDNNNWGLTRVALPASVAPGQSVTFSFNVTAPATAANYDFQWQMIQEGVTWFGDKSTDISVVVSAPLPPLDSGYVSQSVPTTMFVGQSYPVSVTMKNTGTSTWATATDKLGAVCTTCWGISAVSLPSAISSGNNVTFSFNVTAPSTTGNYNFQWEMQRSGTVFGSVTHNQVVNVTSGATPPALPPAATAVNDLPTNDPTVGTMAGQAGTDGGAATYTIPIVVPPGRAGMQPSLSLNYNSRSGNGVMGVGWSISGTSSIHRCPQTPEQDGQSLGVSYTGSDRLCLDGQRLLAYSGTYGVSGTEYRTEVDSYARIIQTGGGLTGTATCFRVEQKDGRILHYGAVTTGTASAPTACNTSTANSRVQPTGAPATLSWLVEKIEDRIGNNQLYSYNSSFGNGEVLLSQISYTGFGTVAGDRTVTFAYTPRTSAASGATDISSSYLAAGLTMQTQAVSSITTRAQGAVARTYTPTYTAAQYSGRLLLIDMTECAFLSGVSTCHPATHFELNDDPITQSTNFPLTSLSGILPATSGGSPYAISVIADLDGDGTRETVASAADVNGIPHSYLVQMTGDRAVQSAVDLSSYPIRFSSTWYADIDGSGRSAVIEFPDVNTTVANQKLSFGVWNLGRGVVAQPGSNPFTPYMSNIQFSTTGSALSRDVYTADVNGDGKIDIIVTQQDAACPSDSRITAASGLPLGVVVWTNTTAGGALGTVSPTFTRVPASGSLFCLARAVVSSSPLKYTEERIDHIADFDGDGLPDFFLLNDTWTVGFAGSKTDFSRILLTHNSAGVLSTVAKSCTDIGLISDGINADDECTFSNGYVTHWTDVNGDGLDDFVYARPLEGVWHVRLNQGNAHLGSVITPTVNAPAGDTTVGLDSLDAATGSGKAFRYANSLPMMDVDSDGKADLLIASASQGFALKVCTATKYTFSSSDGACPSANGPVSGTSAVASNLTCMAYACPEDPGSTNLNMPPNSPSGYQWKGQPAFKLYEGSGLYGHGQIDNSVYHLAMLKFAQTGPNAITIYKIETPLISRVSDSVPPATQDLFGDGLADLPVDLGCNNIQVTADNGTFNVCSVVDQTYGNYGPQTLPDGTPAASFETNSTLYANINQGVVNLGGSVGLRFKSPQESSLPSVKSVTTSAPLLPVPVLPGLLDGVTDGLGKRSSWKYASLSTPIQSGNFPLYSVPSSGGYVDDRHYYFASSMPVVWGMLENVGPGTSGSYDDLDNWLVSRYAYSQAMYNHGGRGFQGFFQITKGAGQVDPNSLAFGPRWTDTTTTFNQKFPLTGKVACVHTGIMAGVGNSISCLGQTTTTPDIIVHSEVDTWACGLTNRAACPVGSAAMNTIYQPFLDAQTSKNFDASTGAQFDQTDTVNAASAGAAASGWDTYGNLLNQIITRKDIGAAAQVFVNPHTTSTTNTYDTSGSGSWWVNKLTASSVTSSISYATSGHALPGSATAPSQTVTTNLAWNADRTLLTKMLQSGITNERSTSTYCYPQAAASTTCPLVTGTDYGLPTQVSTCMGVVNGAGQCVGDVVAALNPNRTMSYAYSSDGYFVQTTTNALSQPTTTTVRASDGQVTLATDPNNIKVATIYDAFGRAIEIDHTGTSGAAIEPAIQIAYNKCTNETCNASLVGEDGNENHVAFRVTTVQTGHPTNVTWLDFLQRPIKKAQAGYSGSTASALNYSFIASFTTYDQLGTIAESTSPYFIGGSPALTMFTYDALNRPTQKLADVTDLAGGYLQTDYTYSGRQTNITVHDSSVHPVSGQCPLSLSPKAPNLCLQMSRSTNVLGQLMQTSESPVLAGARTTLTTDYWTEPQGHVVAMRDAESNITLASYNELGQRTQSVDPDQGTWSFSYDALGELLTQTDARGAIVSVNTRDALGRTTQQGATPPSPLPASMANETTLDTWTYDPSHGIGEVATVARQRGSNRTTPSANATTWQESYAYDTTTARPISSTTTISEGSLTLGAMTSSTSYDSAGRVSTHTYPSGLIVQRGYTAYGQLDSLSNPSTGSVYWTALAQNEWGHVTSEQFPGVITGTHADFHSTGQAHTLSWSGSNADGFSYAYDTLGNVVGQTRSAPNTNTDNYAYDPLQRLLSATRILGGAVNYAYSASGNLTSKSDYAAAYTYGSVGSSTHCGPHAVISADSHTFNCDLNGNVVAGNTIGTVFDASNRARSAVRDGSIGWAYSALGDRDYEHGFNVDSSAIERYFVGDGYRVDNGGTALIHELGPVIVTRTGGVDAVTPVLRDRLGSTMNVIHAGASTAREYDVFGKPRNGNMTDLATPALGLPDTMFGFTNHEHDDSVLMIHMKGRVFDYNLGRFLQVDPFVSGTGSQALNPYSYIGNNPLSGTDPTGYQQCTGSNVEHDSCEGPTLSITDLHSASKSEMDAAKAAAQALQGNGAVSQTSQGAGGIKDQQAAPSDKGALSNAPTTKSGEQPTAESQDQKDTPTLDTVKVTASTLPSGKVPINGSRHLTLGEITLARPIFHNQIDYSKPLVFRRKWWAFQQAGRPMTPNGNIYYSPDEFKDDFSETDVDDRAKFIHELTHVWQRQQGINVMARGAFDRNYDYLPFTPGKSFSKYGIEQQGQIVQDYYYLKNGYVPEGAPAVSAYEKLLPFDK